MRKRATHASRLKISVWDCWFEHDLRDYAFTEGRQEASELLLPREGEKDGAEEGALAQLGADDRELLWRARYHLSAVPEALPSVLLSAMPFWIRLMQCLRAYYDGHMRTRRHLANSIKYLCSIGVVVTSIVPSACSNRL